MSRLTSRGCHQGTHGAVPSIGLFLDKFQAIGPAIFPDNSSLSVVKDTIVRVAPFLMESGVAADSWRHLLKIRPKSTKKLQDFYVTSRYRDMTRRALRLGRVGTAQLTLWTVILTALLGNPFVNERTSDQ